MSVWDYVFDNDYRQRADIEKLRSNAEFMNVRLQRDASTNAQRIEQLETEVGELALLCRSLLAVLNETGAVKPEQLVAAMSRIDAEDGVIDGRVTPESARPGKKKKPLSVPKKRFPR